MKQRLHSTKRNSQKAGRSGGRCIAECITLPEVLASKKGNTWYMLGKRLGDDGFCIVYSGAPLVESGEEVAVQPRHWTFPQYYVSSYYKGANLVQCDQAINKPTNGSCMMICVILLYLSTSSCSSFSSSCLFALVPRPFFASFWTTFSTTFSSLMMMTIQMMGDHS